MIRATLLIQHGDTGTGSQDSHLQQESCGQDNYKTPNKTSTLQHQNLHRRIYTRKVVIQINLLHRATEANEGGSEGML